MEGHDSLVLVESDQPPVLVTQAHAVHGIAWVDTAARTLVRLAPTGRAGEPLSLPRSVQHVQRVMWSGVTNPDCNLLVRTRDRLVAVHAASGAVAFDIACDGPPRTDALNERAGTLVVFADGVHAHAVDVVRCGGGDDAAHTQRSGWRPHVYFAAAMLMCDVDRMWDGACDERRRGRPRVARWCCVAAPLTARRAALRSRCRRGVVCAVPDQPVRVQGCVLSLSVLRWWWWLLCGISLSLSLLYL